MKKLSFSPRPASLEDVEKVAEIEAASIPGPWSKESFAAELEKRHSHFWVVTDDETDQEVLAYIVFSFPAEQAHIQTIAVHPKCRRQGLAKFLLRKVVSFVMQNDGESLVLEVRKSNQAAIQLYQNLGFVIIHAMKSFYPDGEDAYSMLFKVERAKIDEEPGESISGAIRGKANLN